MSSLLRTGVLSLFCASGAILCNGQNKDNEKPIYLEQGYKVVADTGAIKTKSSLFVGAINTETKIIKTDVNSYTSLRNNDCMQAVLNESFKRIQDTTNTFFYGYADVEAIRDTNGVTEGFAVIGNGYAPFKKGDNKRVISTMLGHAGSNSVQFNDDVISALSCENDASVPMSSFNCLERFKSSKLPACVQLAAHNDYLKTARQSLADSFSGIDIFDKPKQSRSKNDLTGHHATP